MDIDANEIEILLNAAFDNAEITVQGGDGKYQVLIVSDIFADLNAVKRQQTVYKILNDHISSGAIHAVNMRLLSCDEKL